jgi:hypothetical protein
VLEVPQGSGISWKQLRKTNLNKVSIKWMWSCQSSRMNVFWSLGIVSNYCPKWPRHAGLINVTWLDQSVTVLPIINQWPYTLSINLRQSQVGLINVTWLDQSCKVLPNN